MQWVRAYDRKIEISAARNTPIANSILKLWRANSMFVFVGSEPFIICIVDA